MLDYVIAVAAATGLVITALLYIYMFNLEPSGDGLLVRMLAMVSVMMFGIACLLVITQVLAERNPNAAYLGVGYGGVVALTMIMVVLFRNLTRNKNE